MNEYLEQLIRAVKMSGIDRIWIHAETTGGHSVELFCGQLDQVNIAEGTVLFIEAEVGGMCGTAFTENLVPEGIPGLIRDIKSTALVNRIPYLPRTIIPCNNEFDCEAPQLPDILQKLQHADSCMYMAQPGLAGTTHSYQMRQRTVTLINDDLSQSMTDRMSVMGYYVRAMAKKNGQAQMIGGHMLARHSFVPEEMAIRCANEAVEMLGATACPCGAYPAVLRGDVSGALLGAFLPVFFAEQVQAGMSPAKGMLGKAIAASCVNLSENPSAIICRGFDDEGTPTAGKDIIADGKLVSLLYTNQSARKDNTSSTGNAFRPDTRSAVMTAATNIILQPGSKTLEELLWTMGDGLLVTECDGFFAGVNPASGDFSLISKGYRVARGRLADPVAQIIIGGNLFSLLAGIREIGCDVSSTDTPALNIVQAPSVLVRSIQVYR